MTDAQEQVLIELAERGPLTWFRLDALLSAAGFQIGPALFAEVDAMEKAGLLERTEAPPGPKHYGVTTQGKRLASFLADDARQHRAWLRGQHPATGGGDWDWIAFEQVPLRDISDLSRGPRMEA